MKTVRTVRTVNPIKPSSIMPCHYCGYRLGNHAPCCPADTKDFRQMALWNNGYRLGRSGVDHNPLAHPSFIMGWQRGNVALEEAENGHDIRREQG